MGEKNKKGIQVLLVEDDEIDVMAVKRAFTELKIANPIHTAGDGLEALSILRGEEGQKPLSKPYLILLDINMPRMNGIEFLKEIRKDPEHKSAIIFMLTTSNHEQDIIESYKQNVAGYIVKSDFDKGFLNVIELIDHYWRIIEFPLE